MKWQHGNNPSEAERISQPIIHPLSNFSSGNCNCGMRRGGICPSSAPVFSQVSSLFHVAETSSRRVGSTYSACELAFIRSIVIYFNAFRALSLCGTSANLKPERPFEFWGAMSIFNLSEF